MGIDDAIRSKVYITIVGLSSAMTILSGEVWNGDSFEDGYVVLEDGILTEVVFGECPYRPDITGCILPGIIDGHTHVGDAGLKLDGRYGLEELVAPPDGLKHRYLRETPKEKIAADMKEYISRLISNGISRFIDFREGGIEGSRMLREACPSAVILGRPVSSEYDMNEMETLLQIADGIGIPSISDMPHGYIDSIADIVKRKKKKLAVHVSERVREDIDYVMSLEPDFIVHMVKAEDGDLKRCADEDVPIVVCTSSNQYFGATPPIKRMIDNGVEVSLGTDNAMLSPSADIFEEFSAFWSVLSSQGGSRNDAFRSLVAHGCNLLYGSSLIEAQTGRRADLIVFPADSDSVLKGECPKPIRYGP